jgi:hypothetical protein
MGLAWFRRELRLKQCCDEELVFGRFDGADLTVLSTGRYGKSGLNERALKVGIHFVIAEKLFCDGILLVESMQIRSWPKANFWDFSRKLWRVCPAIGDRTADWRDDNVL